MSSHRSERERSRSPWLLEQSLHESDLYRENTYQERSPPRRDYGRDLYETTGYRSQDRYTPSSRRDDYVPWYEVDLERRPSRIRELATNSKDYYQDPYRTPTGDRYETQDTYLGSSRDPYRERRAPGRDRYGSLTVDARHTALPERRYESSLTYQDETSRRDSTNTYLNTPAGSIRYQDLVSYAESAGGTPSRSARYVGSARERRENEGGGSRFDAPRSRYGGSYNTYPYDSYYR